MAYTPTKAVSKALDLLRSTLAASTAFRALVGAATRDEALARICFPAAAFETIAATKDAPQRQLLVPRPRAVVKLADNWMLQSLGTGTYRHLCPIYMRLEIPPAEAVGDEPIRGQFDAEWLWFGDMWFDVVAQMTLLMRAGVDGDGNRMFARDSEVRVVEQPDVYKDSDDVIDEQWYGVGLVWTAETGR